MSDDEQARDEEAQQDNIGEAIGEESVAAPVDLPQMDSTGPAKEDPNAKDRNLGMILDLPVDIHVELGQARMNIKNILNFGEGTVIELERLVGDPVDIVVNGRFIGKGEVIVVDENFGIRVSELVEPEKRIESL